MPPGSRYRWRDGTLHSYPEPVEYNNPYDRMTTTPQNYAIPGGMMTPPAGRTPVYSQLPVTAREGGFMSPTSMADTLTFPQGVVSTSALRAEFVAKYPNMAAFLDHPEVGPILQRAAAEHWGVDELRGAIFNTRFWQTSSATDRAWQLLKNEDPAEAAAQAAINAATIQNTAATLGIHLSHEQIMRMAEDVTRFGWTSAQQIDKLVQGVNWSSLSGGTLTASRDLVKSIGANYMVNVSDATAQSYTLAMASGEMDANGVTSVMQAQARARFGWMADEIDQGVTPEQYFMPIRDKIAQTLEVAPEAINLMDSKWLSMVEVHDRETGKTRGATLREAELAARRRPEWQNTKNAGDLMSRAATTVADMFGRRIY